LVNLDGEVVGINTWILSDIRTDTGQYVNVGLGFALPIDSAFDKLGPEIKEAVAKNKAENTAKQAARTRARAERARVAAEDSEEAQAAAKGKVEEEFAQIRKDLAAALRRIEEAEDASQEKERQQEIEAAEKRREAAAVMEAEFKAAHERKERREKQRAEIRAAENLRNPFIQLFERENFTNWAAVPAAYAGLGAVWPAKTPQGTGGCRRCLMLGSGNLCIDHVNR
jgi:hypothetical protein